MTNFNRGGRELLEGQSCVCSIEQINRLLRFARKDLSRVITIFCVLFSRFMNNGVGVLAQPLFFKGVVKNVIGCTKKLFAVFVFLGVAHIATAQFQKRSEISLAIGDSLPESFYSQIHDAMDMQSGNSTTIKMDEYKDKLIVLDFWATWCTPCLASLQKLAGMKKLQENNVLVVPVTYQNLKELKGVAERLPLPFTSIVADTTLSKIFPHQGIPYMVWIKNGKVIDTPQPHWVDENNLKRAAIGKHQVGSMSFSFFDERTFIDEQRKDSTVWMRSLIRRGDPQKSQQSPVYIAEDGKTFFYVGNVPIVNGLFWTAFESQVSPHFHKSENPIYSGVDVELTDKLRFKLLEPRPDVDTLLSIIENKELLDSWIKRRYYTYEFYADTLLDEHEVLDVMRIDINNYFGKLYGIKGFIEEMHKPVAILHAIKGKESVIEKLQSKGGDKCYDRTPDDRIRINGWSHASTLSAVRFMDVIPKDMPLLDSTGIAKGEIQIDIDLRKSSQGDISEANKQLEKYGMKLQVTTMSVPILHIRKEQQENQTPIL